MTGIIILQQFLTKTIIKGKFNCEAFLINQIKTKTATQSFFKKVENVLENY